MASELGDDGGVGEADGDVVDAAAAVAVAFGGFGDQVVAEVGWGQEDHVAGGGDGDGAVGVAGEGEGGVGEEEDVAAVADVMAVEHGVADLHAGGGVAWGDVLDLDAESLRLTPSDREVGKPFGLEWAERFHYRGPIRSKLDDYIKKTAVRI